MLVLAGEPAEKAKTDADAIMRIETALAKASLTRVERRDPHKTYHLMTVAELSQLTPSIDWPHYFTVQGAPSVAKLNVSQPEFMKAVQAELTNEPLDALQAYLRFHLISATAPFLAHNIEQVNFDFYSKTLRGVAVEPPRWKTCVRAVDRNLGEALGQEFVARTFSPQMKAKTQLMTEQIETAMGKEIKSLDWMSPETKTEALRKLHAIRNKIGYPEHWRDYSTLEVKRDDYFGNVIRAYRFEDAREWNKLGKPVDLNEWGMTPPTVNAYFNPQMNDINFPAGVLQPPLYDPKLDDAPNYGNTGSTIGHELTHAFDDEGRQFDAKGNLRDWWTPADAKGFEERINCIRDQYAGYVVVDDQHINSKLTQRRRRRRSRRHAARLHRLEDAGAGQDPPEHRRLHARPALLHRHGAVGLRELAARRPPRAHCNRSALARLRARQRRRREHAGVSEGLQLQSRPTDGAYAYLQGLVAHLSC